LRKGVERDQENHKQDNQSGSPVARPFLPLQQVGDCGTEKKSLQGRDEACGNFHQSKLVEEREYKDHATRHGGSKTQGNRKEVAAHFRFLHFFSCAVA
jgi:hypothetical protein